MYNLTNKTLILISIALYVMQDDTVALLSAALLPTAQLLLIYRPPATAVVLF